MSNILNNSEDIIKRFRKKEKCIPRKIEFYTNFHRLVLNEFSFFGDCDGVHSRFLETKKKIEGLFSIKYKEGFYRTPVPMLITEIKCREKIDTFYRTFPNYYSIGKPYFSITECSLRNAFQNTSDFLTLNIFYPDLFKKYPRDLNKIFEFFIKKEVKEEKEIYKITDIAKDIIENIKLNIKKQSIKRVYNNKELDSLYKDYTEKHINTNQWIEFLTEYEKIWKKEEEEVIQRFKKK